MKTLYDNPDASKLTYETLYDLYIVQNISKDNIAKKLQVPARWVYDKIAEFNLVKSPELLSAARTAHRQSMLENALKRIDKHEFIDLYINQNQTREFMMNYYDLSDHMVDRVIESFNCHKSKKQASTLVLQAKYDKAGGKDLYYKHVHETLIRNLANKGITEKDYYDQISKSCKETWNQKSKSEIDKLNQARSETCLKKYGYAFACMRPEARCKGNNSKHNQAFEDLLCSEGFTYSYTDIGCNEYSREFPISNRSYDFIVNHTLVEINPTSTHNSTWGTHGDYEGLTKDYHYNKSKLARENGYRCICVWDWDDIDKIIMQLKPRETVYARKCEVRDVDLSTTREYLNTYHLQGYARDSIRLGLYYDDELVSIMTFGKPRYNKNYEYELIRYCSSYNVIGGAEKLFSYFVKHYDPQSIISYCDWSKFNGDVYIKLGFTFKGYSIGKHWYNMKTGKHITDNLLRQRGFDQLFGTNYGKGTSNEVLMLEAGFVEIFDAGQSTYIWFKGD